MSAFKKILFLAEQEIRTELRTKESLYSVFLFIVLVLFIFHFSFSPEPSMLQHLAPGIIWATIVFSGSIAISHLSGLSERNSVDQGIVLTGTSGMIIYFSKLVSALVFMTVIELIVVPVFVLFFNFSIGPWLLPFLSVLALGTIGYTALAVLFAQLLARVRFKDLFLPVIFYPFIIPLLIIAVKATQTVFDGDWPSEMMFLLGFDVIFITAAALLFDFAVEN